MSQSQPIPAVIIGVHRNTAVDTAHVFKETTYELAAVLGLTESPPQYQYSKQNLGVVLYASTLR